LVIRFELVDEELGREEILRHEGRVDNVLVSVPNFVEAVHGCDFVDQFARDCLFGSGN
jgi:hypothetical protein